MKKIFTVKTKINFYTPNFNYLFLKMKLFIIKLII